MAVLGGIPLFYELVCEAVYPVAEGVANLSLTYLNNVVAMIFYVVLIFNSGREAKRRNYNTLTFYKQSNT